MRLVAVTAATILGALGAADAASAAYFTAQPPFITRSADPLTWTFEPYFADLPVAYKLSTEAVWHRCDADGMASVSGVPDGRHAITIADDDGPCDRPTTPDGPTTSTTEREVTVDRTPPVIGEPVVAPRPSPFPRPFVTAVSAPVEDALSGVQSGVWTPGDGRPAQPFRSVARALYAPGTWSASITATDRAGNTATRSFVVTVPPPPPRPPDTTPPTVGLLKVGTRLLDPDGLLVRATTTDRGVVSATGTVRIAGRPFALRKAGVRLAFMQTTAIDLRLTANARLRRIVRRALARHVAVTAELRVAAQDVRGNRQVVRRTVRLRG